MVTIETLGEVVDTANGVVAGVRLDQLDQPTPCAEWNVRDLLQHLVAGSRMFEAAAGSGCSPERVGEIFATTVIGDDFAAVFAAASAATLAAWRADPTVVDRPVELPFGELPGDLALQIACCDVFIHAWDLARATDQPTDFDPGLSERMLATASAFISDDLRDGSRFGTVQPVDDRAHPADRLAAFSGRTV